MRKYDVKLVGEIRKKQHIENINGLNTIIKPIPDDDRVHVLDPRVLEIAKQKKKMFAERKKKSGFSLANERFRPDKVTYDLTTREINCEEKLIKILDDHMIDIFIYRPEGTENEKLPVMIYFHGGGWTAGDMKLYRNQMKLVSDLGNCVCVFPEYRVAPECPFPGPIDDCYETIRYVSIYADELNINKEKLMVAGDSAGGGLLFSCLYKDVEHLIKKGFGIYAGVDHTYYKNEDLYSWSYDEYPVIEEHAEFAHSRIDRIRLGSTGDSSKSLYLQGKINSDDPVVSAVYMSDEKVKELPPMVMAYSEYDFLRISDEYMTKRITELGVLCKAIRYAGCDHGFFDLLGTIPQAEELCYTLAEEINNY